MRLVGARGIAPPRLTFRSHHLFSAYLDSGTRRGIDWREGDAFDAAPVEAIVRAGVAKRRPLLIGRVFAADDDDRRAAYTLAKQIQLTALDSQV